MSLNVYLYFDGNCREAFAWYQHTFGGEFAAVQTYGDGPADMGVPEDARDGIMHMSLPLGGGMLMGSDPFPGDTSPHIQGNNYAITAPASSREQCDTWFAQLSTNGTVTMALEETFWGAYFGRVTDQFGVHWMFNLDLAQESPH